MTAFRIALVVAWAGLLAYTVSVVVNVGWDFSTPFNDALTSGTWIGQFCSEFLYLSALAALWTVWRHGGSPLGWLVAVMIFAGGCLVLLAYLFAASLRSGNDVKKLLLGVHA